MTRTHRKIRPNIPEILALLGGIVLVFIFARPPMVFAANCEIGATEVFCGDCAVGDSCFSEGTARGTCTEVPAGTPEQRTSGGVVINAGQMICSTDGVHPALLPTVATDESSKKATSPLIPRFAVNIPTVQLSNVQVSSGFVDIPWIADYVVGVYKYAVFAGSVLAAIMLMMGGLQWLTSAGNASQTGAAKRRITDATIGLVIILGSYLILNTINPNLTALKPLRVQTIPPDPYVTELQSTTVETGTPGDTSYPIAGGSGTYEARFFPAGSCPVTLTASGSGINSDRNKQFYHLIYPSLTGSTQEKFAQAYEAAWLCGLNLGSCGRTISDLAMLVQQGPDAGCLNNLEEQVTATLPDGRTARIGCMDRYTSRPVAAPNYRTVARRGLPMREFIAAMQEEDPQYPDSLSDHLEAGDIVIYYNANSSQGGGHRVYVASVDESGMAQLLNGDIRRPIYTTDRCFSTRCGNFAPLGIIQKLQ